MKSICSKLLLYFLFMSIISLIAVGTFSYCLSVSILKQKANYEMLNTTEQIGRMVENELLKISKYSYLIFTNENIQNDC